MVGVSYWRTYTIAVTQSSHRSTGNIVSSGKRGSIPVSQSLFNVFPYTWVNSGIKGGHEEGRSMGVLDNLVPALGRGRRDFTSEDWRRFDTSEDFFGDHGRRRRRRRRRHGHDHDHGMHHGGGY
ncbi:hypothetical protein [Streptomyces natalensis]|nr:hypothetical protein [Streptomyces natalensis]